MLRRTWAGIGLALLLAGGAVQGGATPQAVGFTDDFRSDSRSAYAKNGAVAWEKGKLTLSRAAISRRIVVGYTAEARAVVRFPPGQAAAKLYLSLLGPNKTQARIGLGAPSGRMELANLTAPPTPHVVVLEADGSRPSAWAVRLEVRFGLARAKAWRDGEPEPANWQSSRFLGMTLWKPQRVGVGTDKNGTVALESLAANGVAPPLLPSERQKRQLDQAAEGSRAAVALFGQGKFADALAHQRAALQLYKDGFPADHPARGPALAANLDCVAATLAALGRWDEALTGLNQALALYRQALPEQHPATARCLSNRGMTLRARGDLGEARLDLEQALDACRQVLSPRDPRLAHALTCLGMLHQDTGKFAQARACLEEALTLRRKLLGPDAPELATTLHGLAFLLDALHQRGKARAHYEEALAIFRKALPADHPATATCLNNLGLLHQDEGRLDEARACLDQALATRRKIQPPPLADLAQSLNNVGVVLADLGRLDDAGRHFVEALALNRKAMPAWHPHIAAGAMNLALLRYDAGKLADGWRLMVEAAALQAEAATRLSAASAQRDHPFLTNRRIALDALLSLAAQTPVLSAEQQRHLLERVLDAKGVSTRVLSRRLETVVLSGDVEAVRMLEQIRGLRRRLADLLLQGPADRPPAQYRALCLDVQTRVDTRERDLAQRAASFADLGRAARATVGELAAHLGSGTVLLEAVEYFHYDLRTRDARRQPQELRYAALLLWRPAGDDAALQVRLVRLGGSAPLGAAVRAWRAKVQAGLVDADSERNLRKRLWEPVARALPADARRLVIAPDSMLSLVPFEALRQADGKYLIERYAVHYVSGGRDLMPPPEVKERSQVALLLADPDYDAQTSGRLTPPEKGGLRAGDADLKALRFRRLAGFAREADAVARLLGGRAGWRVQSAQQGEASEEGLAKAKRPRLLYCITHGFFLKDIEPSPQRLGLRDLDLGSAGSVRPALPRFGADPRLRSGLALAGANKWQERSAKGLSDGLLTALEVEGLDLWGTELVVLSACETGLGEVQIGEGVLGLRRAFQLAGAQTVVASLWKVPDAETEQLMVSFLKRWLGGAGKADALRRAQLDMIRRLRASPSAARRSAPPLYWAGFICHGRAE